MSKGYRWYDPSIRRMYHTLDVTFHKNMAFFGDSTAVHSSTPPHVDSHIVYLEPVFAYTNHVYPTNQLF